MEVERRQGLLLDEDLDRDLDVAEAAAALGLEARRQVGDDEQAAVRPGEADVALDRVGQAEVVTEIDRDAGDLVVARGAGLVAEQPGDVPGERLADRALRRSSLHRQRGVLLGIVVEFFG